MRVSNYYMFIALRISNLWLVFEKIIFYFFSFFFQTQSIPTAMGKKKKLCFKTSVSGFNSICRKINFILEIYQINEMLK